MKYLFIGFITGILCISIEVGINYTLTPPIREYQIDVEQDYYILYDGNRIVDTIPMPECICDESLFDKAILKDNL